MMKYLLFTALLIRLVFIFPQYSGDILNHLAWAQGLLDGHWPDFYTRDFPGFSNPNYPPFAAYLFALSQALYHGVNVTSLWLNRHIDLFPSLIVPWLATLNVQAAFLKLPAILADLGIGYLIYQLASSRRLLLAALYLFNPAVIYISTVWGQIESLPIFFLLLSLYFLGNKKYLLSHTAFIIATLTKQTALWLTPIFLIYWFKKQKPKQFFLGLLFQLTILILFYLPFTHPLNALPAYLATLSGSSTFVSDAAWNFWFFITAPHTLDSQTFFLFSYRLWSIILLAAAYIYVCWRLFKSFQSSQVFVSLFFLSLAAFFLQTRVHERHLAPALVFLLLIPTGRKKLLLATYLILSSFHMLNLYASLRLPFV